MARLILLNGVPAAGKSTLARRYAEDHPGVLVCDIDRLRTMVAGWEDDFPRTGALIRPAAKAFVGAYLSDGHDVVLPQLIGNVAELDGIAATAAEAGAELVHVLLDVARDDVAVRFDGRTGDDVLPARVREVVAAAGGDLELRACWDRLDAVRRERPGVLVVPSTTGDVEATYAALLDALEQR